MGRVCGGEGVKKCQLFAQDWPNLCWGRFNNVEVDSINTLQVTVLKLYQVMSKSSAPKIFSKVWAEAKRTRSEILRAFTCNGCDGK